MRTNPKRGEPLTIWSTKVLENEDGELFINLPDELVESLNWKSGDEVEFSYLYSPLKPLFLKPLFSKPLFLNPDVSNTCKG